MMKLLVSFFYKICDFDKTMKKKKTYLEKTKKLIKYIYSQYINQGIETFLSNHKKLLLESTRLLYIKFLFYKRIDETFGQLLPRNFMNKTINK